MVILWAARGDAATVGPVPAEPRVEPYFPFLADEPADLSVSVGDTSHGYLVNGVEVGDGEHLAMLPKQAERGLRFATRELAAALKHAATALHAATGRKLWIGNLSHHGGGDIAYSVSHNSGRDADIALCYRDLGGKVVKPPDLVPVNGQGVSVKQRLRFDAAATWVLVKALLAFEGADVQYLFISESLKRQLLLYAKAKREPAPLVARAAAVLRQPGASAPHNDHLHLRLYCSERDVLGGCHSPGVVHPWAHMHEAARRARVAEIAKVVADRAPEQRRRALERLALLDARDKLELFDRALGDAEAAVRVAATRGIARLGGPPQVEALAGAHDREPEAEVRLALIEAVGALGGEGAGRFLARVVGEPGIDLPALWPSIELAAEVRGAGWLGALGELFGELPFELPEDPRVRDGLRSRRRARLAALNAAARAERLEPVPALIDLLRDPEGGTREAAARALRRITNLSYGVAWRDDPVERRDQGLARWRAAWSRSRRAPRRSWLLTGFRAAGYGVRELHQRYAWELVRAVAGQEHLSQNAQRVLMHLTEHEAPTSAWPAKEACRYWLRWLRVRRQGFDLPKPPKKTVDACF